MKNKKTYSCTALQSSVYFAPDELRHCCKRFFYKGKLKGDVQIFKVKKNEKVNIDKILEEKKKLINKINKGEENPCTGCPHIVKDSWAPLKNLKIKQISIEAHSVCNMKCTYCSEVYYGGKKTNYDLYETLNKLIQNNNIDSNVDIAWGGGEPVLLENFDKIFTHLTDSLKPYGNMIYSNAIKYNKTIEKYLKEKKAQLTTSIDAGNIETFKKIRGVKAFDKVFENLKKYHEETKGNIIIKYILTKDNIDKDNINGFINKIKLNNLNKCFFQISSDFKEEKLTNENFFSALKMYSKIKKISQNNCVFDYHLKPKIKEKITEIFKQNDKKMIELIEEVCSFKKVRNNKIIIWGSGDTGREILQKNIFFKQNNISIKYFVDTYNFNSIMYNGIQIKEPKEIKFNNDPILIASTAFRSEILNKLMEMGVDKNRVVDNLFL